MQANERKKRGLIFLFHGFGFPPVKLSCSGILTIKKEWSHREMVFKI